MVWNEKMKSFKSLLTEIKPASEKEFLSEPGKLGDCFSAAGRSMLHLDDMNEKAGYKMVHALVYGQGKLKGRRYGHAFNKIGNIIFDNSNGNKITMREQNYFKQGRINPKEKGAYVEYNAEDSLLKMAKYHHWGPWDLNMSLEEEIPDENREIGKKKLRISPKILQIIKDKRKGCIYRI